MGGSSNGMMNMMGSGMGRKSFVMMSGSRGVVGTAGGTSSYHENSQISSRKYHNSNLVDTFRSN